MLNLFFLNLNSLGNIYRINSKNAITIADSNEGDKMKYK